MGHMQRYNRVLISMPRYKRFTQIMDLIDFINFGIHDEPKKLRADPSRDQTYCFIPNSMVDPSIKHLTSDQLAMQSLSLIELLTVKFIKL